MRSPPFAHSVGSREAKIAIVGEAWGREEALVGAPFVGTAGQELDRMLVEAGLSRGQCFLTNVVALQPPGNDFDLLCDSKFNLPPGYSMPPISQGKYLKPEYLPEVERLRIELETVRPNVVVAMGNKACWALLGQTKISSLRGTTTECQLVPGLKVLPTYHPAAILRAWDLRTITLADLMKAKREAQFPEIRRPQRTVLINPTLREIQEWCLRRNNMSVLAVDIETEKNQIKCIGFAHTATEALVIPFIDKSKPDWNYWPTQEEEISAWNFVRHLLGHPAPKLFQNGLFDTQYIWKMGIPVANCRHDTMLLHHSLYPELNKGLGFLGSIYTDEQSWKLMRQKETEMKRDD